MEQLSFDFSASVTQRQRRAMKLLEAEQPTLFPTWVPNIDVHLHSPYEAVAQIGGKDPEKAHRWLAGVTGEVQAAKPRRVVFPTSRLDRLLSVRPPAQVTLDAAALAVGKALWANKLGLRPLVVRREGQRLKASSHRWPPALRIIDAPWTAIATLTQLGISVSVSQDAEILYARRLRDAGAAVIEASLAGSAVLLRTSQTSLVENMGLEGLAYAGAVGMGVYKVPLLLAGPLLQQPLVSMSSGLRETILEATQPTSSVTKRQLGADFPWTLYDFQAVDAAKAAKILEVTGGVLLAGDMGSGKAVAGDAVLETPQGEVRADSVEVGSLLFGRDGLPTRVTGVFPQGVRELFWVEFADGAKVEVDGDHLWFAESLNEGGNASVISTLELGQSLDKGWRIPMPEAVEWPEHVLSEWECFRLGAHLVVAESCGGWSEDVVALVDFARRGSSVQRRALLWGLTGVEFGSPRAVGIVGGFSRQLGELLVWLARSLGGSGSWHGTSSGVDVVCDVPEVGKVLEWMDVVAVYPSRSAPAVCFEVDAEDSLFLTEQFVVTHNTTVSLALAQLRDLWPLLTIAPLSAFSTWERQLGEMGKRTYLATDPPKKAWQTLSDGEFDAVVMSYDRLGAFLELVEQWGFKGLIADEVQRIRTAGAKRSRALRALSAAMPVRIGLSGTPVTNSLDDVLAVGATLVPGEWKPRATTKDLRDMYPGDPVEAVAEHLGSMMVRRRIDEVGQQMPKRNDRRVFVQMTPEQRRAVAELEEEARRAKEEGEFDGPQGKFNALVKLTKMRKILTNPHSAGVPGPNPKLEQALKMIKQFHSQGRKGVVFTVDRASFSDLGERLTAEGIPWGGIWGSTPPRERINVEKRLHAGEIDVVICTIAAGAEAWTASPTATYCMFLSYVWAPAPLEQAEARVYRLNSDVDGPEIEILYLHATGVGGTKLAGDGGDDELEGSLDDRMVEVLMLKKELFAQVVDRRGFVDTTQKHATLSDLLFVLTGQRDEKMVAAEEDAAAALGREQERKDHARRTLYGRKGRNKDDVSLVRDDGSQADTYEELLSDVDVSSLVEDLDYAEDDELDLTDFTSV